MLPSPLSPVRGDDAEMLYITRDFFNKYPVMMQILSPYTSTFFLSPRSLVHGEDAKMLHTVQDFPKKYLVTTQIECLWTLMFRFY